MRIGGLASGMDIDQMVNDLMKVERLKVDKVEQDKMLVEWTQESYNDLNKMFADFVLNTKEEFGLTSSSNGQISNKSVSSLDWIKEATVSDRSVVDANVRADSINGTYTIDVDSLATNWSAASAGEISHLYKEGEDGEYKDTSNLKDQFNLHKDDAINFTIETNNGKINIKEDDLEDISLKDITEEINSANIGVIAIYDESIDRFFIQTDETGEENTIKIEDESNIEGGFINKLKLQDAVDEDGEEGYISLDKKYAGTDAEVNFGAAKNIKQSSNQFTINDINFYIKSEGKTTVTVGTNENAIVEKISNFANEYNALIDKMDVILGEERYRDYPPLTDEQKEAMSENEIKLWEEKAKSGLLRNDSTVSRTMQNLRTGLYAEVEELNTSFSHLNQIGIETEGYISGSMGGRLEIDEEQLRNAIRDDVDGVVNLLFAQPDSDTVDESEKRQETGLVSRMYDDLVVGMKDIISKAGPGDDAQSYRDINSSMLLDFVTEQSNISILDENIMDYEKRILEMERRLINTENRYWSQFTAMEIALDEMYSQSDWLYQQMGMQ